MRQGRSRLASELPLTTFPIIPVKPRILSIVLQKRAAGAENQKANQGLGGQFPFPARAVRGMRRQLAAARQAPPRFGGSFLIVQTQKAELGVRYQNTVLGSLLRALPRRRFAAMSSGAAGTSTSRAFRLGIIWSRWSLGSLAGCRACASWRRCGTRRRRVIITWGTARFAARPCRMPIAVDPVRFLPRSLAS